MFKVGDYVFYYSRTQKLALRVARVTKTLCILEDGNKFSLKTREQVPKISQHHNPYIKLCTEQEAQDYILRERMLNILMKTQWPKLPTAKLSAVVYALSTSALTSD